MIGRGYDGASSMFRVRKSVPAIVKESCPLLLYVHCSADVSNLVLVKPCAIPEIHCTFDFIGVIASFLAVSELYDPIRQVLLELSDLPEEPTETSQSNLFDFYYDFKQILHSTLYSRACYGAYVNFVAVATKSWYWFEDSGGLCK